MTLSAAVLAALLAPHCLAVHPPFNGDATIVRLEPVEGEQYQAFTEVVFVWHGSICNDCVSDRYPRPLQTFAVTRVGNGFVGTDFDLQLHDDGGDLALTWADGRTLQSAVTPARVFGSSDYCAE